MIRVYGLRNGVLQQFKIDAMAGEEPPEGWSSVLWVDLIGPTRDETRWVEQVFGTDVPTAGEMRELEASSRCYQEAESVHLVTSFLLPEPEGLCRSVDVWFNLHRGRLFTVRPERLIAFRLFRLRAQQAPGGVHEPIDLPIGIFEAAVDHLADTLEAGYARLEKVSRSVLSRTDRNLEGVLERLAIEEDLQGKLRLVFLDLRRSLTFLLRWVVSETPRAEVVKGVLRDIESLSSHSSFLFQKIEFLMDATLGLINIEQNKIIKIFSIAAVVFLPPTVVASVYGMNFETLPELKWAWGYPFALSVMVLSGLAPYWYFKRKGWL